MRRRRLIPVAAILSIALLSACAPVAELFGGDAQATRDAQSGEVTGGGQIDVFTLSVGDCLNDQSASEVYEVPVVPCDEPHDYEVYHDFALADGEWDQDAVYAAADEGCYTAFPDFVGLSYEESTLDFAYYAPTQLSWEDGDDRMVSCYIGDPGTQTTGSLAGVAR
ncbi:septum formation family protein [Microbacterium sp. 18062]|uniref:septum formation family protein n=1 Tax=Microbacterium sp. 18062 TaxID=2681410 RepID=UPI00135A5680|nr:septum formation family protein [Microbacterium sp. 18062]